MRIVFMGTPLYAATILGNLLAQHEVVAVYTRADAVRGRGKELVPSPVKQVALHHGIPVHTPRTLRDPSVQAEIAAYKPEVICVAALGMILPKEVLDIPPYGCLNVHASLLPRWRGAAPIERAILEGDESTGVCVMRMEEGLDTGDYCVARTTEIGDKNTAELTAELAELGSQALLTALNLIEHGTVVWTKQDDFFSTYAEKVAKHEFFIAPTDGARAIVRKVQASSPAHPCRCVIGGRKVTVVRVARETSRLVREDMALAPGHIKLFRKKLYIATADQPVELVEVKPDGKKTMAGRDFAAGIQNVKSGEITWESIDA